MTKTLLNLGFLLLAASSYAIEGGFDYLSTSCSAVTSTGACTSINVHAGDYVHIPSVQAFTWRTTINGGTASSVSVTLEGSVDGSTWITLDTSTSTSGETRNKIGSSVSYFRCNVGTYSRNGTTLTCEIMPTHTTAAGGSTVIASGATALGTSAISSGACATVVTVSATGVATTDVIQASFSVDPTSTTGYSAATSGMLTIIPYPTANNVNFKVCNNTSSSITPGAVTLNWQVLR